MLNTIGGAAGIFAFLLLWAIGIGLQRMLFLCVVLNLIAAIISYFLSQTVKTGVPVIRGTQESPRGTRWLLVLAFLSGFITFVLQVSWNRAFAQVHENSVYSFSLIVVVFLVAIASGAELARMLLKKELGFRRAMSAGWLAAGLFTIVSPWWFLRFTDGLKHHAGALPSAELFITLIVVVYVPVVFLSVALPLILQQIASLSYRPAGHLTGVALAANIGGAVLGATTAGFLFPQLLGLWATKIMVGTILIGVAAILLSKTRKLRLLIMVALAVLGWFSTRLDLPRVRVDRARGEQLLVVKEGTHGITAVTEAGHSRRLKLNNHYVLGGTASTGDERLQAHLPLLIHSAPTSAAFLGYGTGITAGGALFHKGIQVTALELVPEIAELAGTMFEAANLDFAQREGTRIIIEDARTYLRSTDASFDVIVGDLVVPWRQGEGALYTLDHFETARQRLTPDGLYCVWLPLFQLGQEDFELLLRTFLHVFGQASVWRGDFSPTQPALALIGFKRGDRIPDAEEIGRRLGQAEEDPLNPQLQHPAAFWMNFIGLLHSRGEELQSARLNTMDQPWVELRLQQGRNFVGRSLQEWQIRLRARSRAAMKSRLTPEAEAGWKAGELLMEFTLLLAEQRDKDASKVQAEIRAILGDPAARSVFGN